MDVFIWIWDHSVSGKIFVPCSVLQHMPWQILSTFISCVFKFERATHAHRLIWLSLPIQKEMTVASAFLYFPGKKPNNRTSDKRDTAYALTAIVGSQFLSVRFTWAEAKQCWTQALKFRMCQVLCRNTSFQSLSCSCLASGLYCCDAAVAQA